MENQIHPILYNRWYNLSMQGLKLIYVSERGPRVKIIGSKFARHGMVKLTFAVF